MKAFLVSIAAIIAIAIGAWLVLDNISTAVGEVSPVASVRLT